MINRDNLGRFFIGYDKVAERLAAIAEESAKLIQNYPPFNIKKISENKYTIQVALAGFTKDDIDIELILQASRRSSSLLSSDILETVKALSRKPDIRYEGHLDSRWRDGAARYERCRGGQTGRLYGLRPPG